MSLAIPVSKCANRPVPRMGRYHVYDPRDESYRMKHLIRGVAPIKRKMWETGAILDQGDSFECVGFTGFQFLASNPVPQSPFSSPSELYRMAQQYDGCDVPHEGTTIRALLKFLHKYELITSYAWTSSVITLREWLKSNSPVMIGTDWTTGMTDTDENGFIYQEGSSVGGHAYLLRGCDDTQVCAHNHRGAVRIVNSWGLGWGSQGKAWLCYYDLQLLLNRHGEAGTAVEQIRPGQ